MTAAALANETLIDRLEPFATSGALSTWETTFYDDITDIVTAGKPLTQPQQDKLDELYTKYCV